jgi:hypothetical protein
MIQQRAKFLGLLLGLSILVGCSSSGGGGGSTAAPTATLTATPATIVAGQEQVAIIFTSTNATQGSIDNGVGPVGTNSQVTVQPSLTTTYTYTATGPGGSASATAIVTVTPSGPAPSLTFIASPPSIIAGQSVTLTWTSKNATSVVISGITSANCGSPPCAVAPAAGGSITQSPTSTTTYYAIATGNGQQTTVSAVVTMTALNSFDGMPEPASAFGTKNANDVDPYGAVGTKQFIEYANIQYQAYDKTTFAPVGALELIGAPWESPLNVAPIQQCSGSGIQLDAVIHFDRLANRWVIAAKATFVNHYYFCIAVSNTDDVSSTSPAFGWNAYFFSLDPILGTNSTGNVYFPDWPKLGVWPDAYYAAMDAQDLNNFSAQVGVVACAFDRINMLAGNPMSRPQCFKDTSLISNGLYLGHSLVPADFDGTTATAPPIGRHEIMVSIQNPVNDGTTTTSNTLNLWDFHVDWTTPANTTFTHKSISVPTPYTPGCYLFVPGAPAITNCIPEPASSGTGEKIDSVGDRFMPRFSYRNFGTYESFLISHTIQTNLNPTQNPLQTGIQWYELQGSGTPSLHQSGIISPDDRSFRFLPSIAQDKVGNAAVGYSVSSASTDPGIGFSYWDLTTGTTPTEVTLIDGAQQGEEITPITGNGEWGTYSSMTIDPVDDCTFWYVNEYWPTNASWATRIVNFKLPTCQ